MIIFERKVISKPRKPHLLMHLLSHSPLIHTELPMKAFCLTSVLQLNHATRIVLCFVCYYLKSKNSSSHKIQIWVLKFCYTYSVYTTWNILLNLEYMEFSEPRISSLVETSTFSSAIHTQWNLAAYEYGAWAWELAHFCSLIVMNRFHLTSAIAKSDKKVSWWVLGGNTSFFYFIKRTLR